MWELACLMSPSCRAASTAESILPLTETAKDSYLAGIDKEALPVCTMCQNTCLVALLITNLVETGIQIDCDICLIIAIYLNTFQQRDDRIRARQLRNFQRNLPI